MSNPIRVAKRHGGETRITVVDWPRATAEWRTRTIDPPRGRQLEIEGPSNLRQMVVAHMSLHVQKGRGPLMIVDYRFEDHLHSGEQLLVLGQLVLCARAVARNLREKIDVGTGGVLWQLEDGRVEEIARAFPRFETVPKHRRPQPGKRYLLWRPPA